jgi:hypothetical protein
MLAHYGRASVQLELVTFSMLEKEEEDKASNMREGDKGGSGQNRGPLKL